MPSHSSGSVMAMAGTERTRSRSEGEESLGYEVVTDTWGCHNYAIFDIKKDGKSILFSEDKEHGTIWMTVAGGRTKDRGRDAQESKDHVLNHWAMKSHACIYRTTSSNI